MSDTNSRIEAKVRSFTEELQALIGAAVREHIENALGSVRPGSAAKAAKAPAAPKVGKAPQAAAPAPAKADKAPKASRRKKGAKRSAAEIQKTISTLRAYVGSKPGQRMEQIGVALSTPTKDLTGPLQKLLDGGIVRREGVKRASKYFLTGKETPATSSGKARPGRKPTGRKPGRPKKS